MGTSQERDTTTPRNIACFTCRCRLLVHKIFDVDKENKGVQEKRGGLHELGVNHQICFDT